MTEQWKDIEGFSNYQISDLGNLRSKDHETRRVRKNNNGEHRVIHKGRLLTPKLGGGRTIKYMIACIMNDENKPKSVIVHRLVAEAFCSKESNTTEVIHINGDVTDNRASNLQWIEHKNLKNYKN